MFSYFSFHCEPNICKVPINFLPGLAWGRLLLPEVTVWKDECWEIPKTLSTQRVLTKQESLKDMAPCPPECSGHSREFPRAQS